MSDAQAFMLMVIGFAVCMGLLLLLIVAGGVGIFWFGIRVAKPMNLAQLKSIVEDWAEENDYELVEMSEVKSRDHPFADRFGFGLGKVAGTVRRIEMRDRKGRSRFGWVFVKARFVGRYYSGFLPGSAEVIWDT